VFVVPVAVVPALLWRMRCSPVKFDCEFGLLVKVVDVACAAGSYDLRLPPRGWQAVRPVHVPDVTQLEA